MKKEALRLPATTTITTSSFEHFVRREASRKRIQLPRLGPAVLAHLDYGLETEIKNNALRGFWKHHQLPARPEQLVVSPRPRHYRTTSKRRCLPGSEAFRKRKIAAEAIFAASDESSLLEPGEHAAIYAAVERLLTRKEFAPLARALNFVVIRGTYDEFMVIFNLQALDRGLHRLLLRVVANLRALEANIVSAFLFLDPSRSPYYLENERPRASFPIKKIFGPERFRLRLGESVFSVPPTSFSQVNESILPLLLDHVRFMTAGENGGRLLDLYCGYGLFSLSLRDRYREIFAVDAAEASIRAGSDMLPRFPGGARIRFHNAAILRNSLERFLPPPLPPGDEDVILDPPRSGAGEAVIATIARRRPGRALHLFCAADEMPVAFGNWRRHGYFVRRVVPLDMFAGTSQLETLVLLTRA